jgi:hypothetical protein
MVAEVARMALVHSVSEAILWHWELRSRGRLDRGNVGGVDNKKCGAYVIGS